MLSALAVLLLGLGSTVLAQINKQCQDNVCYSLNIPEKTASSGDGDIYFQISAPTSNSWAGLGQGSTMPGSNIFVMYTSADGKNVTLSPRAGVGFVEPDFSSAPQVTLLGGSGVSNGMMTANVKCSNCNAWKGGTMNFASNSGSWIWAVHSGPALNSDDPNAEIIQHDHMGVFSFDFAQAKGGSDTNPFTNSSIQVASGGAPSSAAPSASRQHAHNVVIAHAAMASLAFVLLFPVGAIVMRLLNLAGLVWLHAAIQILAYIIYIAAFGMGIWIARSKDLLDEYHPIIGIVLFILLFFQPILGYSHHIAYRKCSRRTIWSHAHIWLGRIIVTLGIINGGLGLRLAANASRGEEIAYGVVAGIMWVVYATAVVFGEMSKARAGRMAIHDVQGERQSKENTGDRSS